MNYHRGLKYLSDSKTNPIKYLEEPQWRYIAAINIKLLCHQVGAHGERLVSLALTKS